MSPVWTDPQNDKDPESGTPREPWTRSPGTPGRREATPATAQGKALAVLEQALTKTNDALTTAKAAMVRAERLAQVARTDYDRLTAEVVELENARAVLVGVLADGRAVLGQHAPPAYPQGDG